MKYSTAIIATIGLWADAQANVIRRQAAGGSGPYPASYTTDTGLPGQTIFLPNTIPATLKLPVIVWGVGGCSDSGTSLSGFHEEIASYGIMVIADNGPTSRSQTNATALTAAADWVVKVAGTGKYANIDKTRIAVSGWSCGGLEAYAVDTSRFTTIGIFSSGVLDASQSVATVGKISKPIFYFLGGTGGTFGQDPAETPGTRDYGNLPKTTPAWIATDNTGHGHSGPTGTNFGANSVMTGAVHWANWLLRGNATAATYFTSNDEAKATGWTNISSQNLASITVTPI